MKDSALGVTTGAHADAPLVNSAPQDAFSPRLLPTEPASAAPMAASAAAPMAGSIEQPPAPPLVTAPAAVAGATPLPGDTCVVATAAASPRQPVSPRPPSLQPPTPMAGPMQHPPAAAASPRQPISPRLPSSPPPSPPLWWERVRYDRAKSPTLLPPSVPPSPPPEAERTASSDKAVPQTSASGSTPEEVDDEEVVGRGGLLRMWWRAQSAARTGDHEHIPCWRQYTVLFVGSVAVSLLTMASIALFAIVQPAVLQYFVVFSLGISIPLSIALHFAVRTCLRYLRKRYALRRGRQVEGAFAKRKGAKGLVGPLDERRSAWADNTITESTDHACGLPRMRSGFMTPSEGAFSQGRTAVETILEEEAPEPPQAAAPANPPGPLLSQRGAPSTQRGAPSQRGRARKQVKAKNLRRSKAEAERPEQTARPLHERFGHLRNSGADREPGQSVDAGAADSCSRTSLFV
jgi:hypothetical protein